jgi:hypothetical protein
VEFLRFRLDVAFKCLGLALAAFDLAQDRVLTSGEASAFAIPPCSRPMMCGGVPAGANRPAQPTTTTLG